MGKPFTPERLENIRRMRKARRLFKQQPLFAFLIMLEHYPLYTYEKFVDDLRIRSKRKKRKGKSNLQRYGRYWRMMELIGLYNKTGNINFAIQSAKLRERLTKPYRVQLKLNDVRLEYRFAATTPIHRIEELVNKLNECTQEEHANKIVALFRETLHIN